MNHGSLWNNHDSGCGSTVLICGWAEPEVATIAALILWLFSYIVAILLILTFISLYWTIICLHFHLTLQNLWYSLYCGFTYKLIMTVPSWRFSWPYSTHATQQSELNNSSYNLRCSRVVAASRKNWIHQRPGSLQPKALRYVYPPCDRLIAYFN